MAHATSKAAARRRRGVTALLGVVVGAVALVAGAATVGERTPAQAEEPCRTVASDTAAIDRVAGAERWATAACASRTVYDNADDVDHVVLARGDAAGGLADALAGAVLADADHVGGPILLTLPDELPEATDDELARLAPERVTILGGEQAVDEGVRDAVAEHADTVERLYGDTREATAAAIAEEAATDDTALVVDGRSPADALVAAAPAARRDAPLLQVTTEEVPEATEEALADIEDVIIVGGHGVVSAEVAEELRELVPGSVRRLSGADRGETAASVARALPGEGTIHLASGDDEHLVDAATAGWAAALPGGGPVLYSDVDAPLGQVERWLRTGGLDDAAAAGPLEEDGDDAPALRLMGGTAVLGDALVTRLEELIDEAAAGGPDAELRGWWVHAFDDTLHTRQGIHEMLSQATASGANTVIVQVARRQDALHSSTLLPRMPEPELEQGLDVLAEVLDAAGDRDLQVHAWMSVMPAYHEDYDDLELPDDHVWRTHGPDSDDPWTSRTNQGDDVDYLDPGVPEVHDHVAGALAELAADYDLAAVHLDYLRYLHGTVADSDDEDSGVTGYHPTSLERFADQTGGSDDPAADDEAWGDWRRDQTRDLARRIRAEVADADPQVAVSQAGITWGEGPDEAGGLAATPTYRWVYQDWPRWLTEGTIDVATPMNYFDDADRAGSFDGWTDWQAGLDHDGLLAPGVGAYLNDPADTISQIERAADRGDGAVLYSHQSEGAELRERLVADDGPWAQPAPAPSLPTVTDDHGVIMVAADDGDAVTVDDAADASHTERADATGHAVFLRLPEGEASVRIEDGDAVTVEVEAGEVERVER